MGNENDAQAAWEWIRTTRLPPCGGGEVAEDLWAQLADYGGYAAGIVEAVARTGRCDHLWGVWLDLRLGHELRAAAQDSARPWAEDAKRLFAYYRRLNQTLGTAIHVIAQSDREMEGSECEEMADVHAAWKWISTSHIPFRSENEVAEDLFAQLMDYDGYVAGILEMVARTGRCDRLWRVHVNLGLGRKLRAAARDSDQPWTGNARAYLSYYIRLNEALSTAIHAIVQADCETQDA